MTLQWADFPSGEQGLYGENQAFMLDGTPWLSLSGPSNILPDPDPAIGSAGRVLMHNNGVTLCNRLALTDPDTIVGVAHRFYAAELADETRPIITLNTTGNEPRYTIRLRPNGGLEIARLATNISRGTIVATADFPIIRAGSWNHVETLVDMDTGEVEVRRNGITVLSYTDPSPFAENIGIVGFCERGSGQAGTGNYMSKDIVVYNGQGSAFNDWQGSVLVTDLRPTADVTLGGWTTSSGTEAWPLIDETPPDDANYIEADDTPPAPAEVTFSDLPPDVTSIRGLISITRSLKTDGGDGNLQTSLSPNGVDYDLGADNPVTTAATYRFDVSQVSPDTAAAWSPAEVDAIRQRYDRTV